ncbi:MAG: di-trans,poly-cis-decaprenylcistransferase [Gemmatimonadaceae bacterium]|nr:di-trans,poly-cis-decaprenylcistransferase [Gemmatimonadaceae bacterium]
MKQSTSSVPQHVAIIMDGNGRWAERDGAPRALGHVAGAWAMRTVIEHCAQRGVQRLTMYAFSSDNWRRPVDEVNALLDLFTLHFRSHRDTLAAAGIRLSVIGQRSRLPASLLQAIVDAEDATAHGTTMQLHLAIDYSSRAAIEAARPVHLAGAVATRVVRQRIDEAPSILPPVDLLVRTGGEKRLSDFLLWESAYAELLFLDVLWPDISADDIDAALHTYAHRDRRFGGLSVPTCDARVAASTTDTLQRASA